MNSVYLAETKTIDYGKPIIQEKVSELRYGTASTIEYVEKAYEFVRVFHLTMIPAEWPENFFSKTSALKTHCRLFLK